jgi:hypothetical protein
METLQSREPVRISEYRRHRRPQPERISGALLWPLLMGLIVLAFAMGVVHGRANPLPPAPIAELKP